MASDQVLRRFKWREARHEELDDCRSYYRLVPKGANATKLLDEAMGFSFDIEQSLLLSTLDPSEDTHELVWIISEPGHRIHLVLDDGKPIERQGQWVLRAFAYLRFV